MKRRNFLFLTMAISLAAGACAKTSLPSDSDADDSAPGNNTEVPAPPAAPPPPAPPAGSQESDWAAIEKLEGEAKALATTAGCSTAGECRAAPVGSRACGGPRYYLPYCAKTTDSVALYRKLDEVSKAEQAYNKKHGIASTCEFRMPPTVGVVAGACAAQ
jgi:hypothetical protein